MLQMFGNNPAMNRAIQMSQGKTEEQMKETVKNLGKQAGIDVEQMANMFGLQGFKRLHRFMSHKDRQFVLKLQHYIIDMYGVKLDIDWKNLHIPEYDNVKDMFLNYLEYENHQYDKISNIYKEMIDCGFIYDAKLISEPLCNISKEIIKCRRYTRF